MIANGSILDQDEISQVFDAALASARTANTELPSVVWYSHLFRDVVSGTALHRRSTTLVMPDDMFIEEVAVQAPDVTGSITCTITSPSMIEPISVTGSVGSPGFYKLPRYFSDATKPQQVLLKGSEVTITASTTDASGTQAVQILLGLVSYRRRS